MFVADDGSHVPAASDRAQALQRAGATSLVQSVCAETFVPAVDAITRAVADRLGGGCLPASLAESESFESCTLTELLPAGGSCDDHPGLTRLRTESIGGSGREECVVRALSRTDALAGEPGWLVERADDPLPTSDVVATCGARGRRIRMMGRDVALGAASRLTCPRSLGPDGGTCHAR